ncbi:MAG: BlaI/MecI/CopY family transcriptional regulator [Acidobacteriota bacterium]|jgi:BlaI family transcriptional regulator, penicillinase repressor
MRNENEIPDVGPLEYRLLRILWKESPQTARQVMDELNRKYRRDLKYTTIMTLLTRLADKGLLAVDRERQPFQFRPAVSRENLVRQRLQEFVDLFFDGRPADLALRLVAESEFSDESIERLEEMLDRRREDHRTSGGDD